LCKLGQLKQITAVVGAVAVQRNQVAKRRQAALQLPTDLAVLTKEKNLHIKLPKRCLILLAMRAGILIRRMLL
jgi:hypothetical protein